MLTFGAFHFQFKGDMTNVQMLQLVSQIVFDGLGAVKIANHDMGGHGIFGSTKCPYVKMVTINHFRVLFEDFFHGIVIHIVGHAV